MLLVRERKTSLKENGVVTYEYLHVSQHSDNVHPYGSVGSLLRILRFRGWTCRTHRVMGLLDTTEESFFMISRGKDSSQVVLRKVR